MVIPIRANDAIELKKLIMLKLADARNYEATGLFKMAQTTDQIINDIHRTANGEYIANIFLYERPSYENYHGIVSDRKVSGR